MWTTDIPLKEGMYHTATLDGDYGGVKYVVIDSKKQVINPQALNWKGLWWSIPVEIPQLPLSLEEKEKFQYLISTDVEYYLDYNFCNDITVFVLIDPKTGFIYDNHVFSKLPSKVKAFVSESQEGHFEFNGSLVTLIEFLEKNNFVPFKSGEIYEKRKSYNLASPNDGIENILKDVENRKAYFEDWNN